jgi:hypothetical protein
MVNQHNSFSQTNSQSAHWHLKPNHVRLVYQNLHFAPKSRLDVGLELTMAQVAGDAKPST